MMAPATRTIVHLLPTGVEGFAELRDGTPVFVRAARPGDEELLRSFANGLSRDALELRFFAAARPEAISREILAEGTVGDRLSLVILSGSDSETHVIGHGEYIRLYPGSRTAEVAFIVSEGYRHRGAATLLLHRLARAARLFGLREFEAEVLPENTEMIEVFRASGFPTRVTASGAGCQVRFPIGEEPVLVAPSA